LRRKIKKGQSWRGEKSKGIYFLKEKGTIWRVGGRGNFSSRKHEKGGGGYRKGEKKSHIFRGGTRLKKKKSSQRAQNEYREKRKGFLGGGEGLSINDKTLNRHKESGAQGEKKGRTKKKGGFLLPSLRSATWVEKSYQKE